MNIENLLHSIDTGNVLKVGYYLSKVKPRELRSNVASDMLLYAVNAGESNSDILRVLLDSGADLKHVDDDGNSAFHYAIYRGNIEYASVLLGSADINMTNGQGKSPLILAVEDKDLDLADLLLQNGADVDLKDRSGRTALMYAVTHASSFMVRLLLDAGADTSIKNKQGVTVTDLAKRRGNERIISLLRG